MNQKNQSKIHASYLNHLQNQLHDNSLSFESIETPGWTSLVATEQSKVSHWTKNNYPNESHNPPHNQILARLNSLPKINNKEIQFSNIRPISSSIKNKNLFMYGSIKEEDTKRVNTPKSKHLKHSQISSNRSISQSKKKSNFSNTSHKIPHSSLSSYNKKPNIFFSLPKNQNNNLIQDSRMRISSARSQSSLKLKDKIQQRLSLGHCKPQNITSQFQSTVKTQPNQLRGNSKQKINSATKFYSNIHSLAQVREEKYMNQYLQKLNQRTKANATLKIFKKNQKNKKQTQPSIQETPELSNKQILLPLSLKRFNTITIHDHLYQKGMKMEAKKQMQRLIDESYQKAENLTFTPLISQKSHFLAESKFSRQTNNDRKEGYHEEICFKKDVRIKNASKQLKDGFSSIQEQVGIKQKEDIAEEQQNRSLAKLFRILSNGTSEINQKNLEQNIEKLPLSLLQILEPLLTLIYKKETYDEKTFIQIFSLYSQKTIKQVALKRKLVATHTQRLVRFLENNSREQQSKQNKENVKPSLNVARRIQQKLFNQ